MEYKSIENFCRQGSKFPALLMVVEKRRLRTRINKIADFLFTPNPKWSKKKHKIRIQRHHLIPENEHNNKRITKH
jgi:hypothetical protein